MTSVAVAVNGGDGGGNGSRRAVKWAVENLMPTAHHFVLVHVIPNITSIPTPSGNRIPIGELDANVVEMYVQDVKEKIEEVFVPYKKLCRTKQERHNYVETLILEDDDPAAALLRFISESEISCLVMGSCSSSFLTRKLKGPGVPTSVLRCTNNPCDIYVVSKQSVIKKAANPLTFGESSSARHSSTETYNRERIDGFDRQISELHSFSVDSEVSETFDSETFEVSTTPVHDYRNSDTFSQMSCQTNSSGYEANRQFLENGLRALTLQQYKPAVSLNTGKSDEQAQVENLREELQSTIAMYKQACEELVHAQKKVQSVSSVCLDETRRVNAALERGETLKRIAAEEKEKHLQAVKEVERARQLLAKESYERQIAEVNALEESLEKRKLVDALFTSDSRYRRYTRKEIDIATSFYSEDFVIGEGGYGKVYKCNLDHTPVAVKVLQSGAAEKKQEFLKEVEVLSQLHHPNIVLLLGACPESGCLVYEYMENGSLEDYIYCRKGRSRLPWFVRFRIVFEIACGLAFLHYSKPEPIVHRDLKPGNILLDRNYVSKIGDVGLAKLISDVVPDNITEYQDSIIAGTLFYMDPEYQRTGTIRPKSDLYAFGVIILQLLTSRHPRGLLFSVENAVENGSLVDVLDKSVTDWPLVETEELVQIALKCSKLRCRDRPDLEGEVLPVLRRLADVANASSKLERNRNIVPSHYYCPILQEIMDDPYIAADGFTYEYRAIKAWLDKHNVSPVTRLGLHHSVLTPNHTLRSAINDWRSQATFPGA